MTFAENQVFTLPARNDNAASAVRVALLGGARLHRTALRHLVESDGGCEIVVESERAAAVLPRSESLQADVIVLDIDDAMGDALALLEEAQSALGGAAILILTASIQHDVLDPLLLAGARGVVFKHAAASHLLTAIRKVQSGELWVDRATASRLINALAERRSVIPGESRHARLDVLSRREREVVSFVVDGLCNKAIANKMGISDNTVRHHLTSIYAKLETRDRLELVIYALRQGVNRVN